MANDTTYYWRIDEVNAGGTTTGSVWSFTTIVAAPGPASSPSPGNGTTDVAVNADLSWTAGSGAASHDVYFGTSSPGSYQGNQAPTTFDTGAMANDTTYYWRIDEVNAGGTTTGSVWSFTTIVGAPSQATSPSPADSATDVAVDADLSWTAGSGATSHDVYFGTSSPGTFQGNQAATTFDTGAMANDTTYYWRIDEVNAGGTTTGSVWSFTTIVTAPGPASSPSPADSATDISINADLSWTAGSGATTHDVYFGTSSPGSFQGNQAAATFDPGAMDYDTTYYWRIDEVNAGGTTTGSVWSFTTGSQPSVDPNLVGWWELENNANDSAGANDGTIYGAVGTSGKFGQALSFDEVDDYVDIPDFDYTNTSNEFSLSFWFRIADVAGSFYQYMYSHGNYGATNSLNVYFSETDEGTGGEEVRTNITLSDSTSWQPSTSPVFADGQWHMYTITVSSVDGATIYVDANSVLTNPAIKGAALNPTTAIHIGARCDYNVDRYYGNPSIDDGLLDDVRLYNRVLNQTDINDIYAGGPVPPSQATNPAPADTAADVSIEADLSWTAGSGATSHDVYLGTTSPGDFQGNQTETTFEPGTLSYDITYYWRIDQINTAGTTTGNVWSFTTEAAPQPPEQASNPDPADSAADVSINADLSWTAGSGSTSSDVYFGTTSPGAFQGNQTETSFDPGTMANDTTYYWRIDEINAVGTTTGVVWSFTTIVAPPGQASNPDPADSAANVDIDADLSWTAGTGSTSSDVYFGTTSPGSFQGNQTAT
ncbi:MAG: LamG-like jellyroll fold domain-containing protein, partial [Planctomycetota bacterium]